MSVAIHISHARKVYGENVIIPDLSLDVKEGEFFTLLGSSGCGKTTLLRMIAGFNTIEGGDFFFNEQRINDIPRNKRNIGMVFQNYAVFPHMTTFENVAFGLEQRHVKDPEKTIRVEKMLDMVQIASLRDRKPQNMSGGQQQRIALARAIVIHPDVLLMDEPLSNLDAKLRIEMRGAIRTIQKQSGITTVYVTHDQSEALAVSDRIAIMHRGIIQQVGTPLEVYCHPSNLFCASFIGESNMLEATALGGRRIGFPDGGSMEIPFLSGQEEGRKVKVCVRPDEFVFSDTGVSAKVVARTFLGSSYEYQVALQAGTTVKVETGTHHAVLEEDEPVHLSFDPSIVNVFDSGSGDSLMVRA
ncbi:MAG: ABC transporter ATP-binding protein [Sphaerochaetaceae bacterium]|nr:ABC transporter ATP-binding protein [Spirochaetales bacterium]MDY5499757.1 ABC transporter ATP-binding protein [Sphaerochaetaceae bacterium]